MGQLIEVESVRLGDVAIFDTDRSLSGQDGETFDDATAAAAFGTFPAMAAAALMESDEGISSVYVYSNTISVKRRGEWTEAQTNDAAEVIRNFLVHYAENRD